MPGSLVAGSLYGVRVRGHEEGLRQCAHPFSGVGCKGHAQYPALAPNTQFSLLDLQKWWLGFWSFCVFCSKESTCQ